MDIIITTKFLVVVVSIIIIFALKVRESLLRCRKKKIFFNRMKMTFWNFWRIVKLMKKIRFFLYFKIPALKQFTFQPVYLYFLSICPPWWKDLQWLKTILLMIKHVIMHGQRLNGTWYVNICIYIMDRKKMIQWAVH